MNGDRAWRSLLLLIIACCCCLLFVTGGLLAATLLRWADAGAIVLVLTPAAQRTVRIIDAGQTRQLQTALHEPLPILARAGISLGEKDKVWINGALAYQESLPAWTVPASQIEIRRAVQLRILDDGAEVVFASAAETIGEALDEAGISLGASDEVNPPLDAWLERDMDLRITRAMRVRLLVDGEVINARTRAESVGQLLDAQAVRLGELDFTRPPADAPIKAGMEIEIVRVTIAEEVAREEIPPGDIEYRPDPQTPLDQSSLLQEAQPGIRETITRVRYENGREVSREVGDAQLVQEAQHEIRGYGTKVVAQGTIAGREYWRRLCLYATSYHPGSNNGNTQTATGATLRKGIVARKINSRVLPLRGEVYVQGYGIGNVADQGAGPASSEYWIDLGYSDHDYRAWHEYVWVYLLMPPQPGYKAILPRWTPVRSDPGNCA